MQAQHPLSHRNYTKTEVSDEELPGQKRHPSKGTDVTEWNNRQGDECKSQFHGVATMEPQGLITREKINRSNRL